MHVDHLIFAAGPEGLASTVERLGDALGAEFINGGFHPRFGTRNNLLPLTEGRYLEVVEVLDHPAADKAVFGQAVRARSEMGGGWLGWVVSVDDLTPYEQRLERQAVPGSRHFPDGRLLEWEQLGIRGLMADPQLPYFLKWISPAEVQPSALQGEITLEAMQISGNQHRVEEWIGTEIDDQLDGVRMEFNSENGAPGLVAAVFNVPGRGEVRI
ncbi:VOC family protein [Propionibacteriaceae bacterium G1746]|uniref:VOC family protein n=1 Tax=Aestuariimicrobium sp. G57 TaxID=3418485 RepID=UPI003C1A6E67